jgi:hypothetical protein
MSRGEPILISLLRDVERSKDDVVHTSRIHINHGRIQPIAVLPSCPGFTSTLIMSEHKSEPLKAGQDVSCVPALLTTVVMDMRRLNLRVGQMEMGYQQCHGGC